SMIRQIILNFRLYLAQAPQDGIVIVLAAPCIARDPASTAICGMRGIGLGRVVVEGANNHAASPRRDARQRRSFQIARVVASLHVFHFAVASGGDPLGKGFDLAEIPDWRDATEIESSFTSELLYAGCAVGRHERQSEWNGERKCADIFS